MFYSVGSKQQVLTSPVFRCLIFKWWSEIQTTIQIQVQFSNGGLNTRLNLVLYLNGIQIRNHMNFGKLLII